MKATIHPQYFDNAQVVCACGNTFTTGSTKQIIHVELCNKCHPFYTGQQKFVDSVGRVEQFQKRQQAALEKQALKKAKVEQAIKEEQRPKTLREMIDAIKQQGNL